MQPYPLQWPLGYPQTKYPRHNPHFKTQFASARDNCIKQIKMLGGTDILISTDIPVRMDGLPYADAARRVMKSQGVAVYFNYQKEPVVFCCDKWDRVEHNMHAISMSIEAIRGLDRWGVSEMLKRVFSGFEALPQPSAGTWYEVLKLEPNALPDVVKAAYRRLTIEHHPDRGGNRTTFEAIQAAYEQYKTLNP